MDQNIANRTIIIMVEAYHQQNWRFSHFLVKKHSFSLIQNLTNFPFYCSCTTIVTTRSSQLATRIQSILASIKLWPASTQFPWLANELIAGIRCICAHLATAANNQRADAMPMGRTGIDDNCPSSPSSSIPHGQQQQQQ